MSSFNPNDKKVGDTNPIVDTTAVTPSEGQSSFGDTRIDSGNDAASMAQDIGVLIGSIGGSVAGIFLGGAVGGPLGAAVGIWAGGVIGAGFGGLIAEALADAIDNDDATVWYSLSDEEKDELVNALMIEALVGLLPPAMAGVITKAPKVAGAAGKLKDRLFSKVSQKTGSSAVTSLLLDVGSQIIDEHALVKIGSAMRKMSKEQQDKVIQELAEKIQKSSPNVDLGAAKVRSIQTGQTLTAAADDIAKELRADMYNKIKDLANTPEGIKVLEDWRKSKFTKLLFTGAGVKSLFKVGAYLGEDEVEGYNYGGLIAMNEGGISIAPSKRGTFKAQASRMGMSVQGAANKILAAPEGTYSPAMRKKANFAKNFAKNSGGPIIAARQKADTLRNQLISM